MRLKVSVAKPSKKEKEKDDNKYGVVYQRTKEEAKAEAAERRAKWELLFF